MSSNRFQIAAERAALAYPEEAWSSLRPSERSAAIYRELRKLDEEFGSESAQVELPSPGAKPVG
jgi:hypothetical protein